MKRTMTCVTSLVALMVAAPLAFAQDRQGPSQDSAPSQMENNAGGSERGLERSGGQRNETAGDTARDRAGSGSERGSSGADARDQANDQKKQSRDAGKDERKDAKDENTDRRDAAKEQRQNAKDDKKSGGDRMKQGDRNERAGSDQDRSKSNDNAGDRNQQEKTRDQAQEADKDKKRQRTQDQANDRDSAKDRQSDQAQGQVREEDRQKAEQVRSKVDTKERERIRDMAFRGNVRRATNVDVRVDIGVRLPRRVEVYDLPSDIVEIVPAYRGYRYVVIGDDYCIVDPETYVIVDVIPRGGGDRGQYAYRTGGGARLELTNDQIEIIRREIKDRGRNFDFDGDLEVGITLPGDFAFEPFPDTVVREVPLVRDYRFVHVEDEIAIVAKDQPEVIYVFED